MTPAHLAAGAAAGAAGALGLGSGSLLLVCLELMGVDRLAASGINLLFFPFIGGFSLWLHHRRGLVNWSAALPLALFGCLGAALGSAAAGAVPVDRLSLLFGVMLALLGLAEVGSCLKKLFGLYKSRRRGTE